MNFAGLEFIHTIARGGMGEVILAYDPFFKRHVAVKKIRSDLKNELPMKKRFLREAKITAQLTHPGVINIYSLHEEEEIYYVMPYIQGKTLKEILHKKNAMTIASYLPLFKSICQTIAYAHSKKIIHKDLKPENILVGNYGEVIVLDWGLSQYIGSSEERLGPSIIDEEEVELTNRGKIVGTLAYMAPERAMGAKASFQSDIYALGVILYQLLTLRLPFKRISVKEFRKSGWLEKLVEPEEKAPYRDVPPRLSRIVKKCLAFDCTHRYQNIEDLLADLSSYMEGRSEWYESQRITIYRKKDWEFKENILFSRHVAISRFADSAEWFNLMISKASFADDIRLETRIMLNEKGSGIGFLLNAPEKEEREHPLDGYCLWLGTEEDKISQIFRNQALVMNVSDLYLSRKKSHKILIEKNDNKIHLYIDDVHRLTFLSHIPLLGSHVGVLFKDVNFEMDHLLVSIKSPSLQVSCLSVPDAFLAAKDYVRALAEYRRISHSFPGQTEAQIALFRAGITLLEQGKMTKSAKKRQDYFTESLEEFAKLHNTAAAPLEYLGKSLVYQVLNEPGEEIKSLELALRRYQKHPLIHVIEEEIYYRMQESAQNDRRSAYELILIALQHLGQVYENHDSLRLFRHLINHWEPLYFLENPVDASRMSKEDNAEERLFNKVAFAIPLAFWTGNLGAFSEIFQGIKKAAVFDEIVLGNILYALCELGVVLEAKQWLESLPGAIQDALIDLKPIFLVHDHNWEESIALLKNLLKNEEIEPRLWRIIIYLMQYALFHLEDEEKVHYLKEITTTIPLSLEEKILLDAYDIWAYLKQERYEEACQLFSQYPLEMLNQESTLLHPLYGCYLRATESEELALIHLSGIIDTPFPRSWALLGHELCNHILEKTQWRDTSFMWERRHLLRQLTLYYQCAENPLLETYYREREKKEYL